MLKVTIKHTSLVRYGIVIAPISHPPFSAALQEELCMAVAYPSV